MHKSTGWKNYYVEDRMGGREAPRSGDDQGGKFRA